MYSLLFLDNLLYVIIFLFGLSLGSFLNAWAWRIRENFTIINGRSMCPHCRRQLAWYENIPVVSFLVLRGKCRTCKNSIPPHYIFVEVITALVFVLVSWQNFHNPAISYLHFVRDIIFSVLLILIFVYDLLYQEILPEIVWCGVFIGLFCNFFLGITITSMLLGAMVVGGFFLLQFVISRGRWIGGGDVRLGFMMGIWLGWPQAVAALLIAYSIGCIGSLFLLATKSKTLESTTPFGTYLSIGTLVCILWGERIVGWYMRFLR